MYVYKNIFISNSNYTNGMTVSGSLNRFIVSASRTVGREFASRPGHTKDHHRNGTNCLPAWHAMR